MKKVLIFTLAAILTASCSTFDKYKTPEAPGAGVGEGEKSSYLLNKETKTEEVKPVVKTKAKKKISKKKGTK